jgi:hypothetical protein
MECVSAALSKPRMEDEEEQMPQTTLNVIAISVFGMTLLVLLGPLLNIPPAIPAVATLSVLSLATLDTISFQGKGITLLLDWLAGTSGPHRDRVLHHEAGHFLVAYFLGIPITAYTLTAWETFKQGYPGSGGVLFDSDSLKDSLNQGQMRLTLDRFCTVWMAGIAAENIVYGSTEGGAEDRAKLQTALISFGRTPNEVPLKERWAELQAHNMIEKHRAAYDALVSAMEQRASVAECYQVIQENCH